MRINPLLDAGFDGGGLDRFADRRVGVRFLRRLAGEQQRSGRAILDPVGSELLEESRRERRAPTARGPEKLPCGNRNFSMGAYR